MFSTITVSKPFSDLTKSKEVKDIITEYRASINVTDLDREKMLKHGRLELPSTTLRIDDSLKQSHLLQLAMRDPKAYIKARVLYLEKIKEDVNSEFLRVYAEYTADDDMRLSRHN